METKDLTKTCYICGQQVGVASRDPHTGVTVGHCCMWSVRRVNAVLDRIMPMCGLRHPKPGEFTTTTDN